MLENGYVMLHRSILNWEWYKNYPTKLLFLHLLLTANWEDKRWQGKVIKRGQRLCSLERLTQETDLTRQQLRTAIKHLISTGEITTEQFRENSAWSTLFTLNSYEKYQSVKPDTADDLTTEQPQTNHRATRDQHILNKYNKDNKDNKDKKVCRKPAESECLKKNYSKLVSMTQAQYEMLIADFGEDDTSEMINILDRYKTETGKAYENDYLAIRKWVYNKLCEDREKAKASTIDSFCLEDFTEKPW